MDSTNQENSSSTLLKPQDFVSKAPREKGKAGARVTGVVESKAFWIIVNPCSQQGIETKAYAMKPDETGLALSITHCWI